MNIYFKAVYAIFGGMTALFLVFHLFRILNLIFDCWEEKLMKKLGLYNEYKECREAEDNDI